MTAREAYKKLEDTKWKGRAMLGTALALVGAAAASTFFKIYWQTYKRP